MTPTRSACCPTTWPPRRSAIWCGHLRQRSDAQNIDLMGLAGFCRNCLADWIIEAGYDGDKAAARELIHGMPMDKWKANHQTEATAEQLARMEASMAKNG